MLLRSAVLSQEMKLNEEMILKVGQRLIWRHDERLQTFLPGVHVASLAGGPYSSMVCSRGLSFTLTAKQKRVLVWDDCRLFFP